jgi:hypothetical protein
MASDKVGYIGGSLSSALINRLLSKALVKLAPPERVLSGIAIKDLPVYRQDFDADDEPKLLQTMVMSHAEAQIPRRKLRHSREVSPRTSEPAAKDGCGRQRKTGPR